MRKILLGLLVVSVIVTAVYLHRRKKHPVELGYAANRKVMLWNTVAAIRQPVATVAYGERLEILQRFENKVKVRTASGVTGWTTARNLLTPKFWEETKKLVAHTASMPVEARGHTAVLTNLHVAPGREAPRIRQLGKMVPVEMFERKPLDVPGASPPTGAQAASGGNPPPVKKEDWWLVRARLSNHSTLSGWVLGRFIKLDLPEALYDYASSADMKIVAWFELDRVPDGSGGARPQYLVAGTRGPEGQPCDFTLLRVYTWSKKRQRYETAYVDSGLCGELPVRIKPLSTKVVNFSFDDRSGGSAQPRVYRLSGTIVRREKRAGAAPGAGKNSHG